MDGALSPRDNSSGRVFAYHASTPWRSRLGEPVSEGTSRWEQTFGDEGARRSHFLKTQKAKEDFLTGARGLGMLTSSAVVSAFDLDAVLAIQPR